MKNFIFKSTAADLHKMFSILENLQKNMVYVTYRCDSILKLVKKQDVDSGLQKQVDSYFEEDNQNDIPEVEKELGTDKDNI